MWSITVVEHEVGWTVAPDEMTEKPWTMDIQSSPQHIIEMFEHLGFQVETHPIEILNLGKAIDPIGWLIDYDSDSPNAVRLTLERSSNN